MYPDTYETEQDIAYATEYKANTVIKLLKAGFTLESIKEFMKTQDAADLELT